MSDYRTETIRRYCKHHKYSDAYADYWVNNLFCRIALCGNYSAAPHHIKSRGAGGGDEPGNLMALCTAHHNEVHTIGRKTFMEKYGMEK